MNTLRLPIAFNFDGTMETITDGTDEFYATLLGNAIQIQKGELALSRLFGTDDPSFSGKSLTTLINEAASYVPEILVSEDSTVTRADSDGNINLKIKFKKVT